MNSTDFHSIDVISRRLFETTEEMQAMTDAVAKAKQCREYDSDRRKRALSCGVADYLKSGESATAAEHKARASDSYAELMKATARDLIVAEKTIHEWIALQARFEALRSLLSVQKSLVQNL